MENSKKPNNQVNEQAEQAAALKKEQMIKIAKFGTIAVIGIIAIVLIYIYAFRNPAIESTNEAIAQADVLLIKSNGDSTAIANALTQYEKVANDGSTPAANRAKLMSAIILYKNGEYAKCIEYLDDYSTTGAIIDAGAYSLKGDCYVNTNNFDDAIDCYEKAVSISDENQQLAPFFMAKIAEIYHEQKEYAKELDIYEEIKTEYPQYSTLDVDKYIERAKALIEKK